MEKKSWHEWLNSLGMVVALILAGVTFYYQFLRTPRELTANVLPLIWNKDGMTVTVRVVIRNGGAGDEIVEAVHLVGPRGRRQELFGAQVIRPGEAKVLRTTAKLEGVWMWPWPIDELSSRAEEGASIEVRVVDRTGRIIVSSVLMTVVMYDGVVRGVHVDFYASEGRPVDLLRGQRFGTHVADE